MKAWSRGPLAIRNRSHDDLDTSDFAESESIEKTNIRNIVRWSEYISCQKLRLINKSNN